MSDQSNITANSVMLVDDEKDVRDAYSQMLELEGFDVSVAGNAEEALSLVTPHWPGVLLTDIRMPVMNGLQLFERVREIDSELPVIMITAHGDISMAVSAIRQGAYEFIEKPPDPDALITVVGKSLDKRRLVLENRLLRGQLDSASGLESRLIGHSTGMQRLRDQVAMLAEAGADVLIVGETGAGKELVARCLHDFGARRDEPFVAVNCAGLPESIIESELFGHEDGAFTGARGRRIGKIEYADGGTLFLDEIESMPLLMQAKLLRVLQERTLERLGSNKSIKVDIRVIAAAKSDLKDAQDDGSFRSDLFYRINVASVAIPTLRERREDIAMLFCHFANLAAQRYGKEERQITDTINSQLMAHDWPGNVRELRNLAERYVLGLPIASQNELLGLSPETEDLPLNQRVDHFEKAAICEALRLHNGRIGKTAAYLKMPHKTLYLRMRKHGIERKQFVSSQ